MTSSAPSSAAQVMIASDTYIVLPLSRNGAAAPLPSHDTELRARPDALGMLSSSGGPLLLLVPWLS